MEHIAETQDQQKFAFHKAALWIVGVLLLLALLEPIVYNDLFNQKYQYPESVREVIFPELKPLQVFSLVDDHNSAFGLDQLKGRWTFLVFGYTHCPDICPATLSQLTRLNRFMNEKVNDELLPQFLFVSVDPARDKVKVLKEYINYFDNGFIAVTGTMRNIEDFEGQFNVFHQYDKPDSDGNYAVTHSAEFFLVDPKVRIVAKFTPPISTQKVIQQYQDLMKYFAMQKKQIKQNNQNINT
jgi:protein SCO1/2